MNDEERILAILRTVQNGGRSIKSGVFHATQKHRGAVHR